MALLNKCIICDTISMSKSVEYCLNHIREKRLNDLYIKIEEEKYILMQTYCELLNANIISDRSFSNFISNSAFASKLHYLYGEADKIIKGIYEKSKRKIDVFYIQKNASLQKRKNAFNKKERTNSIKSKTSNSNSIK